MSKQLTSWTICRAQQLVTMEASFPWQTPHCIELCEAVIEHVASSRPVGEK
jgi:hypothetical protein